MILKENPDGSNVRLRDVARIELGALTYQQDGTFNGKPASVIAAFQTPGSNALDVQKGILRTMEEVSKRFPPGIAYKSRSTRPRR